MKRFSILFFVMICCYMTGFSQKFEGGLIGGLNASQVDGDGYSGYRKPGLVFGGYVQTNLSELVFATMELKFAQKGSKNIDSTATEGASAEEEGSLIYKMRLNYAEMPIYIGIRTSDRISVLGGVSVSYLIKGTEYDNYGKFVPEDQHAFESFDVQAMLGFRFQITDRLFVDMRGAYSVMPIRAKPGNIVSYWKGSQFNNLINTTVLYRLDF